MYPWPLENFGAVFIIPTLQKLSLSNVEVRCTELRSFLKFQGETDLKDLCIHGATMSARSLGRMLSFPRALSSLRLYQLSDFLWTQEARLPEDQDRAISRQSASLEVLEVDDIYHPVYIDKSMFPKLREVRGCHEKSSGVL